MIWKAGRCRGRRCAAPPAAPRVRGDQAPLSTQARSRAPGLVEVDVLERVQSTCLPSHSRSTTWPPTRRGRRGQGEFRHHLQQPLSRHAGAAQGHHLEGRGEQGVTGQDRVGFAIHLVVGGPAATEVVVVHGRQVVMDQRHGVDHLQRHRRGHRQIGVAPPAHRPRQAEDRPQPLAARQERVAHRLPQALGPFRAQGPVEGFFHPQPGGLQVGGEIEARGHRHA